MVIFILFMIVLIAGSAFYIAHSVKRGLSAAFPKIKFWVVFAVFATLASTMVIGFMSFRMSLPSWLTVFLSYAFAYGMGFYLYLIFFAVISDGITLVLYWCKRPIIRNRLYKGLSLLAVGLFTFGTVICGIINANDIDHVSYEVKIENKADISDINLVMISDVHLGAVGSEARLADIVAEINGLKPDVVCIAGDFFDTVYDAIQEPEKAIETMKQIFSTYGVYACLGNHDAGETTLQMQEFFRRANVTLLNDEYVIIDNRLVLVGRLDASPIGGYGDVERKELSEFFTASDETLPVIVLDHNPKHIDTYGTEVDLVLSGHTHNGQIFPATLVTELTYTVDHGYYRADKDSPHVIVTSGVGYWGMPLRVGTDSEIVSISFVPSS